MKLKGLIEDGAARMQRIHRVSAMACLIIAISAVQTKGADSDATTSEETTSEETDGSLWQPLIEIDSNSRDPFVLNESAAQILVQANNETANEKLRKIKQEMTELITDYASTQAGKEAAEIVDKAGLKVAWNYIYPKETFGSYVPLTR